MSADAETAHEATEQTRAIWSTLLSVEEEMWQVEAMLHAVGSMFRAGSGAPGLDTDACLGGDQIVLDILERLERVNEAWREAVDKTGVKPVLPERDAA